MRKLIGISGKKQSGKNTVTKIWQLLDYFHNGLSTDLKKEYYEISSIADIEYVERHLYIDICDKSYYKQKSFANKLKQIVCLLIGCSMEQLEDNIFKETPLGNDWIVYKLIPKEDYDVNLLDSSITLNYPIIFLSEKEAQENIRIYNYCNCTDYEKVELTPRLLLQLLGTQCGREIIHPNIWVNALFSEYVSYHNSRVNIYTLPKWIISDVRFENEAKAIKERNGIIIRVNRNSENKDNHQSEIDLDNYKEFDYTINNIGFIKDLIEKVKAIMIKEGVI